MALTYKDYINQLLKNKAIADTPAKNTNQGYYNAILAAANQQVPMSPQAGSPIISQATNPSVPKYTTPYEQLSPYAKYLYDSANSAGKAVPATVQKPNNGQINWDDPKYSAPMDDPDPSAPPVMPNTYEGAFMQAYGGGYTATSFDQWINNQGKAYQQQYEAALRQAELDYAKNNAAYGARGEAMAQAGLTTSGYGDYMNQAAFAAMQGAKVDASNNMAINAQQAYQQYLLDEQAAHAAAAAIQKQEQETAQQRQLSANQQAAALAADGTYSQEEARQILQTMYGYDADMASNAINAAWEIGQREYQRKLEDEEKKKNDLGLSPDAPSQTQIDFNNEYLKVLNDNGWSIETANEYFRQNGYTEEFIKNAQNNAASLNATVFASNIKQATDYTQLPTKADINAMVAAGTISKEQADTLINQANKKRAELLRSRFDVISDQEVEAYFQEADALYKSGNLSLTDYTEIHKKGYAAAVEQTSASNEPATVALKLISDIMTDKSKNSAMKRELSNYIIDKIEIFDYDYKKSELTISVNGAEEKITVYSALNPKETESISKEGARSGEIKAVGDNLYIFDGRNWRTLLFLASDVGGKENAAALKELLKAKAGKSNKSPASDKNPAQDVLDLLRS